MRSVRTFFRNLPGRKWTVTGWVKVGDEWEFRHGYFRRPLRYGAAIQKAYEVLGDPAKANVAVFPRVCGSDLFDALNECADFTTDV